MLVIGMAETTSGSALHERLMRKFDSAWSPQQPQRATSLLCRRFATLPGGMWEGDGWDTFGENMVRIEDNQVARGLEKLSNDYRANRVIVDFRSIDGDDETAETLDGLFRADMYRSIGGQSVDNAFDEGSSGGLGAWRLCNKPEDEFDPDNEHQIIDFEITVDADQACFWDPNSKRYDKTDAKWACVVTSLARATFEEEYPDADTSSFGYGTWRPFYDWYTPDVIRIAEWYQVEEPIQTRVTLTNKLTDEELRVWAEDVDPEWVKEQIQGGWKKSERQIKRRRIHKYILSGSEILEDCGLIAGSMLPIIPYYGKRWFIDNQERFRGHTQLAMDLARVNNTLLSNLVESVGSQPRDLPVFYPEEITEEMGEDWARASKDRLTFLRRMPMFDAEGNLIPRAIDMLPAAQLSQQMAALLQITGPRIAELTNSEDGADEVKSNVSHEAMDLAATRTDEKSSGYMDNMRLSMELCGRVYLEMAKEIYVEEGRKLKTRSAEGAEAEITLMEPKVDKGRYLTVNDFASGRFNVISDVTESSATKRDKTVRKALGVAQIAGANGATDLANAALLTAVVNMDGDGMEDFKAYARKAGIQIGLVKPTEDEQQEMAQEAQAKQGQPDPTQLVLLAQAKKFTSEAGLSDAKAQTEKATGIQKLAQAHLNNEQADAVGGPVEAPAAPTGLEQAHGTAEVVSKLASANLNDAKAAHLRHDMEHKTIKRGHELMVNAAGHDLAVRQQDHAEAQPANDRAAA